MRGSRLAMKHPPLEIADKETVAAEVSGTSHRSIQRRESMLPVQRLRGVHAGKGFKIAAFEIEAARRFQAALHHACTRADAAGFGQKIHLAQLAYIRLTAVQCRHAAAAH